MENKLESGIFEYSKLSATLFSVNLCGEKTIK
jgi:hypothetical protein